jgi:hypothetical protein
MNFMTSLQRRLRLWRERMKDRQTVCELNTPLNPLLIEKGKRKKGDRYIISWAEVGD